MGVYTRKADQVLVNTTYPDFALSNKLTKCSSSPFNKVKRFPDAIEQLLSSVDVPDSIWTNI